MILVKLHQLNIFKLETKMNKLLNLAEILRSKNAGPFYITFDIMFKNKKFFEKIKNAKILNNRLISDLYQIDEKDVRIIYYDIVNAVKITIKRKYASGDINDTDVYGAQQQSLLENIQIP